MLENKPVGIDINQQFVDDLSSEGFETHCLNADNELPFKDNQSEIIYSDQVMEHLVSPVNFLCEVKRILKPNGTLILGVPNIEYRHESAYYNPVHFNYYNKKSLRYTLLAMGFDVKSVNDQKSLSPLKRLVQTIFKIQGGAIYALAKNNENILSDKKNELLHQASKDELDSLFK